MKGQETARLHLGCGQKYLQGYVNIDFPFTEDRDLFPRKLDLMQDITTLKYDPQSIVEIRTHHMFEHFVRPVACALLVNWNYWLKEQGCLRIEVPDLSRSAIAALNPFGSAKRKGTAMRHLFGSHQASWAVHCEGYTKRSLRQILSAFGFETIEQTRNSWQGTYNIELVAVKKRAFHSTREAVEAARRHLQTYLIDESETERQLLDSWIAIFTKNIEIGTDLAL